MAKGCWRFTSDGPATAWAILAAVEKVGAWYFNDKAIIHGLATDAA